ncbi:methyltransferase domain-containing protein [Rhizobium sp. LCM 4573]|uniref:methyltransferase domain-containing protein n=1 Tax=Rhizobium sp. LCM 4573 TaxID=1848291 RepID=UPI00104241CC|nr:methyltransferase domain-containing protein [Rhizobium sp. LCM 4573]
MTLFQNRMISNHVRDLTFVDVGGLWGTNNEKVTLALQSGAKTATMADMQEMDNEWWQAFRRRAAQLNVSGYAEKLVNLDDPRVHEKLGTFDFVHCSGIVYHVPSPFYTIQRLASLTKRYLLLGSMVVPEVIVTESGELRFDGGQMIYIPAIGDRERTIVAEHFNGVSLSVAHINLASNEHFSRNGEINYGPWWWLYSSKTMKRMLEDIGFKVIEHAPAWEGRSHYFFCEKV